MSKLISFILVLVLFFGTAINSFAGDEKPDQEAPILLEIAIVVGAAAVACMLVWVIYLGIRDRTGIFSEAETPDNGIELVSTEDKAPNITTDGKTVLNILKHIEAGVTPNKDIYVGLRFQY